MIPFRPVTPADRARFEHYTHASKRQNCDLAFANIYCWKGLYRSELAEVEGDMVIRFRIDGGEQIGYMFPLGEGDLPRVIEALRSDAANFGQPLRLMGLEWEDCCVLKQHYGGAFAVDRRRSMSDYIYRREDLCRLSGKHFQPKRNHLNRFRTHYPNHRFEPLTPERFTECLRLEQTWCQNNDRCREAAIVAEREAMQCAFDHFEELGLRGGCLYVEDRLVAFTYGSTVNHNTFVIHVEKADTHIEGAFAMINHAFAQSLDEQIEWINREEDLGIEGLRKAKLSYNPTHLVDKYSAVALSEEGLACRRLWEEAFPTDEERFLDRFLVRYFRPERMLTCRDEQGIIAMAHLIPFATERGMVGYLYGVATASAARGQGLASELIERAATEAHRAGCVAVVLIPGNESLRTFYAARGFSGHFPLQLTTPDYFDFGTGSPDSDWGMWRSLDGSPAPEEALQATYID